MTTTVTTSEQRRHRDARSFPEPEQFRPERWMQELNLPKMAYFPFGGGPRVCIGSAFAMMEATLGLATIVQKFGMTAPANYRVTPFPSITLQPKTGITLGLVARSAPQPALVGR